uniref:Serine protease inhibitor n=1 Tax=Rhipicephalus zambeziensis TaxID=60191 RepID=A0A224YER2_9ACAR
MGIKDFFSSDADLSAISEKKKLAASEVVHKAFVEVNEEGTEAAAATAVMMLTCCMSSLPPRTYKFIVDRPFMFVIRSRDPDLVLFMGSVRDL